MNALISDSTGHRRKGEIPLKVIAISGKARHGKDTTALMMRIQLSIDSNKILVAHQADLLKYICRTFFGWDGQKDEAGRQLLQHVGTDVVRKKYPDFWVDFIVNMLKLFPDEWDYVLIPDCRFPNEIERMREAGLDVTHVRVVRPNFESPLTGEQQKHPSETALDEYPADAYIINDGTLHDLYEAVADCVRDLM